MLLSYLLQIIMLEVQKYYALKTPEQPVLAESIFSQFDLPQPKSKPVVPVHTIRQDYVATPKLKIYSIMFPVDRSPRNPTTGIILRNRGRRVNRIPDESTSAVEDSTVVDTCVIKSVCVIESLGVNETF